MTDHPIPPEIRERARDIARKIIFEAAGFIEPPDLDIATNTIIAALLAERRETIERCARIAETDADWTAFRRRSRKDWKTGEETNIFVAPDNPDESFPSDANIFAYKTGIAAGAAIAAAIRAQIGDGK